MPYNDDENHSPSEFYYPEQTNDSNKYGWKFSSESVFFYKVTTSCDPTQSHKINRSFVRKTSTKNLRQYFPVQTSHSVNKSLL